MAITHSSSTQHDLQFDYYGKKLAVASSDGIVRIYSLMEDDSMILSAELKGFVVEHFGIICQSVYNNCLQKAWGCCLEGLLEQPQVWRGASCQLLLRQNSDHLEASYQQDVGEALQLSGPRVIWSVNPSIQKVEALWMLHCAKKYVYISVSSVAFAPHQYGLVLACGSADGAISIIRYKGDIQLLVSWFSVILTIVYTMYRGLLEYTQADGPSYGGYRFSMGPLSRGGETAYGCLGLCPCSWHATCLWWLRWAHQDMEARCCKPPCPSCHFHLTFKTIKYLR